MTLLLAKTDKVIKWLALDAAPILGCWSLIHTSSFRGTIGTKASLFNWVLYFFYFQLWTWILSMPKSGCTGASSSERETLMKNTGLCWRDPTGRVRAPQRKHASLSGCKQMRFASASPTSSGLIGPKALTGSNQEVGTDQRNYQS